MYETLSIICVDFLNFTIILNMLLKCLFSGLLGYCMATKNLTNLF